MQNCIFLYIHFTVIIFFVDQMFNTDVKIIYKKGYKNGRKYVYTEE